MPVKTKLNMPNVYAHKTQAENNVENYTENNVHALPIQK